MSQEPRFIADVMLGRLAKWLRIAGYDVLYDNKITDDNLIAQALDDDRIILTRDARMVQRRRVKKYIFIESDYLADQLRQVMRYLRANSLPAPFSRCLLCNVRLQPVEKREVAGKVPPYVFDTQEHFKRCSSCGRIYWAGTHRQKTIRLLEALL